MKRLWLLAAVLLAVAQGAATQDLGAAADKEKARRKKVAGPATVYTNEDLDKGKPSPSPSPSPTVAPAPPTPGAPTARGRARRVGGASLPPPPAANREVRPETESEGEVPSGPPAPSSAGAEVYWRGRAQELRKAVSETEKRISTLEERIQQLQLDRDPNPPDLMDPNRLQKRDAERLRSIDEVEKAKATLAAAQKALADFQEDARRKGVPPSWIE